MQLSQFDMPGDWKIAQFSDIAELRHGYQFRNYDYTDDGIRIFKITQIQGNGSIDLSGCSFIDATRGPQFERIRLNKGDILMALTGATIGKIARFNSDQLVLQNYRVGNFFSRDSEILSKDYLYHFLRTKYFFNQLLARQTQSAQQNIGKEDINNMSVFLPSIKEQRVIAFILSALDDKIELNLKMNKTLEDMAMSLYKHWFVDFGPFQEGEFVESELGMIPKGWVVKRLDEIALKKSETFDFTDKQEVVFINTGDVQEGRFLHSNYISKIGLPGQAKKAIRRDDILYSEIRPKNKRYAYVNFDSTDYVVSTKFMIINPKKYILNKLLYRVLTMQTTVDHFNKLAEGRSGTFPQITFDAIREMKVVLPPLKVQSDFQTIVAPMEVKQDELFIENQTLTKLRDTLLPKLISGEVRVKNIEKTIAKLL